MYRTHINTKNHTQVPTYDSSGEVLKTFDEVRDLDFVITSDLCFPNTTESWRKNPFSLPQPLESSEIRSSRSSHSIL